jgi:hypothetical protein
MQAPVRISRTINLDDYGVSYSNVRRFNTASGRILLARTLEDGSSFVLSLGKHGKTYQMEEEARLEVSFAVDPYVCQCHPDRIVICGQRTSTQEQCMELISFNVNTWEEMDSRYWACPLEPPDGLTADLEKNFFYGMKRTDAMTESNITLYRVPCDDLFGPEKMDFAKVTVASPVRGGFRSLQETAVPHGGFLSGFMIFEENV